MFDVKSECVYAKVQHRSVMPNPFHLDVRIFGGAHQNVVDIYVRRRSEYVAHSICYVFRLEHLMLAVHFLAVCLPFPGGYTIIVCTEL